MPDNYRKAGLPVDSPVRIEIYPAELLAFVCDDCVRKDVEIAELEAENRQLRSETRSDVC